MAESGSDVVLDERFKALIKENHIHKGRWWAVLIVSATLVVGIPIGGVWWTARTACEATNRATHKVTVVIDTLAADTTYPKGAGGPLRTQIDKANKQRRAARTLADGLLSPEDC